MKIEMGESLFYSWLRHVKECSAVQTNWSPSKKWEYKNETRLIEIMSRTQKMYGEKFGYDIFGGTRSVDQLLSQAEIDVLGLNFTEDGIRLYMIDVAFHEGGLNYGSKQETIERVVKKYIRAVLCGIAYFCDAKQHIVFASPKINPAVEVGLTSAVSFLKEVFQACSVSAEIDLIANEDFNAKVLQPILLCANDIADTAELFMRAYQLFGMFDEKKVRSVSQPRVVAKIPEIDYGPAVGMESLRELKVGQIANSVLRKILTSGKVSKEEIWQMQTPEYSKRVFDLQYPLLRKCSALSDRPYRYYKDKLIISGEYYFLCSEWFETPSNNDRIKLLSWLKNYL